MNKWMLASLSVLLAGATALPANAQEQRRWDRDASGQPGQVGTSDAERAARGQGRQERGEDRRERGESRREDARGQRGERRDGQADGGRTQPPQLRQLGMAAAVQQARQERGTDRRDGRVDDRRDRRGDGRYDGRSSDRDDNRYDGRYSGRDDNRYDGRNSGRYDSRQNGRYDVSRYSRRDDRRWNGHQWYPQYRYRAPVRYVYPRGYRSYQWQVGNRLPSSYYGSNYYVDYNAYRLPPPPYGYNWVRVDRDVILVSIASGLIRDILYGLYY